VVAIDAKKGGAAGAPSAGTLSPWRSNPTWADAVAYARELVAIGAGEILLTSMDRDGHPRRSHSADRGSPIDVTVT